MEKRLVLVLSALLVLGAAGITANGLPADAIVLEAEAAKAAQGVAVVKKDGASGGQALDCQKGAIASYEIDMPKAGVWYLWVRLFCPSGDMDSFYFGIEGADPNPAESSGGKAVVRIYSAPGDSVNAADSKMAWYWDAGKEAGTKAWFIVPKPGKYVFFALGREPGTLLDQILLTMEAGFDPEKTFKGAGIAK